jgi:hypothetical protein
MSSDRWPSVAAAVLLGLMLAGAGMAAVRVQKMRTELQLVVPAVGSESMPPHVAVVTAALGTFRGLAVDFLWARADHLQYQGEYFEAQTLAQWITTLQPRFHKVWAFQAFNMAYNISVATQVPSERWSWVARAIDLLRRQGIPLNPKAPQLQMELSWIFHNKIGTPSDKDHWYYKAKVVRDMQEVIGDMTSGRTTADAVDRFRAIATAPATLDELVAKNPAVRKVLAFLATHGMKPDETLVRMLGRVLMYSNSTDGRLLKGNTLPADTNGPFVTALREDRAMAALLVSDLVPHLQQQILRDRYNMDPTAMLALMDRYGPLDWRHPKSHGIYWSEEGLKLSRTLLRREEINELMLLRTRLHMMTEMMMAGRVEFDPVTNRVDLLPDPRFAKAYETAIAEAFDQIDSEDGISAADFGLADRQDLANGYERFLNSATLLTFLYGDRSQAQRYFSKLQELAGKRGEENHPAFNDTVETFVALRIAGIMDVDLNDLREFLDAMIRRAVIDGLAQGQLAVFNRYLEAAYRVYDRRFSASDPSAKFTKQQAKLLEFPKLVDNSFESVMKQASLPVLTRARIWAWAPDKLRHNSYEAVAETLRTHAEAEGLDFDRAFPAPVAAVKEPAKSKSEE